MPSVRLDRLRKVYGDVVAVDDISVEFEEGKLTSILGPSGCGKTTMLNMIAGFVDPDGGTISFGDRVVADPARRIAVPSNRRNLGMVFQSYALWPHLRIGQNVAYGLRMRNVPKADREAAVRSALERVGLFEKVDAYPHELSGGQQQRIALARAIAYSPEILLFDEPLSNLDAQLRERMRDELKAIHRAVGVTAIYVTHDQNEAMALSDRIVVMSRGRIEQIGTPRELYEEPANVNVARFVGKSNIVGAVVLACGPGWADVRVDGSERTLRSRSNGSTRSDQRGSLSIRPEGVRLRSPESGAAADSRGQIVAATYLGNMRHYRVRVGGDIAFEAECGFGEAFDVGDDVAIEIDPERCYFIVGDRADDVRG